MTHVIGESDRQEAAELGIVRDSEVASIAEIEDEVGGPVSITETSTTSLSTAMVTGFSGDVPETSIESPFPEGGAFEHGETILFPRLTRSIIEGETVSTESVEDNFVGDRQPIAEESVGDIGLPSGQTVSDVTPDVELPDLPGTGALAGGLGLIALALVALLFISSFAKGAGRGAVS